MWCLYHLSLHCRSSQLLAPDKHTRYDLQVAAGAQQSLLQQGGGSAQSGAWAELLDTVCQIVCQFCCVLVNRWLLAAIESVSLCLPFARVRVLPPPQATLNDYYTQVLVSGCRPVLVALRLLLCSVTL